MQGETEESPQGRLHGAPCRSAVCRRIGQDELLHFVAVQLGQTTRRCVLAKRLQESNQGMGAYLERSRCRVLIRAHPLEVSGQQGLIDCTRRRGHKTPFLTKVVGETVHREPDTTQVFLQGPAVTASRGILVEEPFDFACRHGLTHSASRAAKMLVQMTDVPQMKPRRPTTEPVVQQPLTKTIQELPQRGAPKLGECRRTLKDLFQCHDSLLFSPRPSRRIEGCHRPKLCGVQTRHAREKRLEWQGVQKEGGANFT